MAKIPILPGQAGQIRLGGDYFTRQLRRSREIERKNAYAEACELRIEAVEVLLDVLGDEGPALDWDDENSRAALELLYMSGVDHLGINEIPTAVALWEALSERDEEDHFATSIPLAFCYVVLEDFDCLESVLFDISPKRPEYHLLMLWQEHFRSGGIDIDSLRELRTRHKAWFAEILADTHPVDEAYLEDSRKEKPSPATEARELWFVLEPLFGFFPDFLTTLRKA